ncbi:MAG: outer membrane beta-barrel protein [Acidobacteria bacterium]|nr:outer membrane beta-barrel protein [Acidobacteriota bacterium]
MQRVLLAVISILLVAGFVGAQDFPKVEIFGGYSLTRIGGGDINDLLDEATLDTPLGVETSKLFKKGFDASFTYNVNHYFGIEAAFQYNSNDIMKFKGNVEQYPGDPVGYDYDANIDASDFSFMAGPKFAYRKVERITPFAHILFGINRVKMTPSLKIDGEDFTGEFTDETGIGAIEDSGFGLIAGGGLDVNVSDTIAIRPIQFDYLMGSHSDSGDNFKVHNIKLSFGIVFRLGGK